MCTVKILCSLNSHINDVENTFQWLLINSLSYLGNIHLVILLIVSHVLEEEHLFSETKFALYPCLYWYSLGIPCSLWTHGQYSCLNLPVIDYRHSSPCLEVIWLLVFELKVFLFYPFAVSYLFLFMLATFWVNLIQIRDIWA